MDIIITEEQRLKVCEYLEKLLLVFRNKEIVTNSADTKANQPTGDKVWQTFDEWSQQGFRIRKGERGTYMDGKHKFSNKQVREYKPFPKERPPQYEFDENREDEVPF